MDPIATIEKDMPTTTGPSLAGETLVNRIRDATEWAQAAIVFAQEEQQNSANRTRQAVSIYKENDLVWLNLKNIHSARSYKKLDWLYAQYKILEILFSHTVKLDTPGDIHPVFYVDLVRPAASDPLPTQIVDDSRSPPIEVDGELEWQVDEILEAHTKRKKRWVLMKWTNYAEPT
ncbi:hypothetical protein VI817_006309 [Penicillium citrinum]|nr:hypothetical protein VI817_006309 [Penicillium citrinum]